MNNFLRTFFFSPISLYLHINTHNLHNRRVIIGTEGHVTYKDRHLRS
jgi:hypothetical protein